MPSIYHKSYNAIPENNRPRKPILCIDFDGVIHGYSKGWQNGVIYDPPVPGFFDWALKAKEYFVLTIYSSRSISHKERKPMEDYLTVHLQAWQWDNQEKYGNMKDLTFKDFVFAFQKPAAFLTIDDRAITFTGDWARLDPQELLKFRPWTAMKGTKDE